VAARPGRRRLRHLPASGRYHLDDEQALALADETSPAFVPSAFQPAAETSFNHVYEARP
jgi:hypothetical protein